MLDIPLDDELLKSSFVEHQTLQQMYQYGAMDNHAATDGRISTFIFPSDLQQPGSISSPMQQAMALDSPMALGIQDASGQLWTRSMMPALSTSFDQFTDFQLIQSAHPASDSPVLNEEYSTRRSSLTSNQDVVEWHEKARNERRKVQNRTAQRAYRERKEKALSDLRELLDQKESQYQALQREHCELQRKYAELLHGSNDSSTSKPPTSTCNAHDFDQATSSDDSSHGPQLEHEQG